MPRKSSSYSVKTRYPVLPLRNMVLYPHMIMPLFVGRAKSIAALEDAFARQKELVFVAQKVDLVESPSITDLYEIGTLAKIVQLVRVSETTIKILVEGIQRVRVSAIKEDGSYFSAEIIELSDILNDPDAALIDLGKELVVIFEHYVKSNKKMPAETLLSIIDRKNPSRTADLIASYMIIKGTDKQHILETLDVTTRITYLLGIISQEIEFLKVEDTVNHRVQHNLDRVQKEYYLKEKIKVIQSELGNDQEGIHEQSDYEQRIEQANMPVDIEKKALKELHRLTHLTALSSESGIIRTYLDWLLDLPWQSQPDLPINLAEVDQWLNTRHFGLEKIKERIIEYFAVLKLTKNIHSSILCLCGPPGVGKTSVGKSIAEALGRKFARISLGGIRDEAEIRGHRRTYVGAMPGRIIQAIQKTKTLNPVILLDEIDKLATDYRGDPGAALMEILDPEQNHAFSDHYLEVPYDLSQVLFIATANATYSIPAPLLDRMEVMELSGYTVEEKKSIAEQFLIPKTRERSGLSSDQVSITNEALELLIVHYTREAGVRELERNIAALFRKVARRIIDDPQHTVILSSEDVIFSLGPSKYNRELAKGKDRVGVALGLAYTVAGGDTLPIEVAVMPGSGRLILTGKLGDVMQESAQTALSYLRSQSRALGLKDKFFSKHDLHVHVPEGAVPKDGPSAGITIATAMISAIVKIPVKAHIAMTGEVTLQGRILAIGGLKEKILAAHQAQVHKVLIPKENEKQLADIPAVIRDTISFVGVTHIHQVFAQALIHSPWEKKRK